MPDSHRIPRSPDATEYSRRAAGVILLTLLSLATAAQVTTKSFRATYTATPPGIDGRLDDSVWASAAIIDDMHEVDPIEYSEPMEKMRVRVLYDEHYLYVAAEITIADPSGITAFRVAQGSDIQDEDRFKVVIDPYNNQRSGYDFRINPNGVREEGLFGLLGRPNTDWNGIWDGRAQLTETGWTAEMAIPFKTLNFDPRNTTWGISFSLNIPRRNEQIAWTSRNRVVRPGTLGVMTGIEKAEQGHGLDIVPSVSFRRVHNYATGADDLEAEPSVDVFYKLTPELTGALTVNTDFSAVEVDDRVINLDRFPVFFPEKRAFFLQDADIFSFGGIQQNGTPFFSRRIGLDNNRQPVDLLGGAKLTGRTGPLNLGVLNVLQDAENDDVNLFVGRGFVNVFDLSTLGFIHTQGSPDPDVSNSVTGVDFNYINRELFDDKGVNASFWYLQSDTDDVGRSDEAYGFQVQTPQTEGWFGEIKHKRLGRNYAPALGFVNRPGIRDWQLDLGYRLLPKDSRVQSLRSTLWVGQTTDLAGVTESQYVYIEPFQVVNQTDDRFALYVAETREVLTDPFEIADGVVIGPGDYRWRKVEVDLSTGDQRAVAADVYMGQGDFYDGKRFEAYADLTWQPSKYLSLSGGLEYNDIELEGGEFITRLMNLRTNVAFSSAWSWSTLAQYDNDSEELSVNSRLRWIPRAGRELIIVLNHGFLVQDAIDQGTRRSWRSLESDVVAKMSYTFRY